MLVFPHVKINIGLFITGKRPDGYHNIESVFYPVAWHESLEVTDRDEAAWANDQVGAKASSGKVRFMSYGLPIPGDARDNLCIMVYHALEKWYNLPAIDVHLIKSLPIGAGLGGGSADAAFALRAMKEYFSLRISDEEAMKLLAEIGSDCPFFWKDRPMFVHGRGELMRPIELDLSAYWIALIHPGIHVSTKDAYAGVTPGHPPIDLNTLPYIAVEDWKEAVCNDFEASVFVRYPKVKAAKQHLYDSGADYASMTGSGSAVYGLFPTEPPVDIGAGYSSSWVGQLTL